ncbi:FAD-binding oxidoreductase [Parendozoicomonas haliclonae]|uniref:D-amino acid dehydrogenase small subunit n=2 Tax=Parendozoicomonas haliclonae TaxID=1960125 RepID=A0A1X7AI90_9GAMM|nr:D-amino acid dehydrogenase small subunit [Parendozoicomonas haliclonae]
MGSEIKSRDIKKYDTIVIGGGIVGLAIAEKLSSEGQTVALVERDKIAAGASYGNASSLAYSDIMPLASPGMIRKAIKWFIDPLGPFSVVPKDIFKTAGWLTRFFLAARTPRYLRSIDVQASLMHLSRDTFPDMLERTGLTSMIRNNGALHLYQDWSFYRRDLQNWAVRLKHGINYETYEEEDLHHFQPGLSKDFVAGVFVPQWQTITNPADLCTELHEKLSARGVDTFYSTADDIQSSGGETLVSLGSGEILNAHNTVLAAGVWSAGLSRQLGDHVPVIGERGYNTTLPKTALPEGYDKTLVFSEHGFLITPLSEHFRIGGASEIAALDQKPNYKRAKLMAEKATKFLPELSIDDGEQWMGQRPSIPDTLPVIGRSSQSDNIIYAFGHGHLGLTQSAATAQLVSELIQNKTPSIDIHPLRVDRF